MFTRIICETGIPYLQTSWAASGVLVSFLRRLGLVRAEPSQAAFFAAGMSLVLLAAATRFRFSRFPLHPVLFLAWGTHPAMNTWSSFLVGWFVKTLIVRLGGGSVYQRLKPLFVGLLCGEVVAVGVHVAFDFVVLLMRGTAPDTGIFILPG